VPPLKKKKAVVDPDTRARQSLAAMEEIQRAIKQKIGTQALHDAVMGLPDDKRRIVFEKMAKLKELQTRDRCRLFFKDFVNEMWPGNIPGPHFDELEKIFHRIDAGEPVRAIVCLPPRFGKALEINTKIPTPSGFKRIIDIQVGDVVFGVNGKPTLVIGKSDVFKDRKLFKCSTSDGYSVLADSQHVWTVRKDRKAKKWTDELTEAIASRQAERIRVKQKELRPPALPLWQACEMPHRDMELDPYVLGVWLGDGGQHNNTISKSAPDSEFMIPKIRSRGVDITPHTGEKGWTLRGWNEPLRRLGLKCNKHIPEEYLFSSIEQRTDLVNGLMDTDGEVRLDGCSVFYTTSEQMATQFARIVNSLGKKASISRKKSFFEGRQYKDCFAVCFYMANSCSLPRKKVRARDAERQIHRMLFSEECGTGDTVCIEVAASDGLFLCGENFIPTHNSERLSYLFPAWYIGKHPEKHIIQASNVKSLAEDFGGKIRNLVDSEDYKKVFPGVSLAADSSAKGRWNTNKGGRYFAVGAGGTVVGRGAHLLILDDPISEQAIVNQGAANQMPSKEDFEKVYNWFTSIRGRIEPGGSIIIVMQRWAPFDLVGRLMDDMKVKRDGDQWEIIELPALLEKTDENGKQVLDADGQPSYDSLWPQRWPVSELLKLKATLPSWKWYAQYLQDPRSDESAIIKREFWKIWGQRSIRKQDGSIELGEIDHNLPPPKCEYVIQSWDTAYTANTRSDYSACVTVGVFTSTNEDGKSIYNVIVLDAQKWKLEYSDLKIKALEKYKQFQPDTCIIEAKAAGLPLLNDMRKMGIPMSDYTPTSRTGDKLSRVNAISDLFASGYIWIPARHWAEDLIEEFALFPNGEHDDLVDSMTQALLRFRMGGFIQSKLDEEEEEYAPVDRQYY